MHLNSWKKMWIMAGLLLAVYAYAGAQTDYKLHISSIETPKKKQGNLFGRPFTNDYVVRWELYTVDSPDEQTLTLINADRIPKYHFFVSKNDSTFSEQALLHRQDVNETDSIRISDLRVGRDTYFFRVIGVWDDQSTIESDIGSVKHGLKLQMSSEDKSGTYKIPLFFPLANIVKFFGAINEVYDHSSFFGQFSFTAIWYFAIAGVWFILFRTAPSFRRKNIFPMTKVVKRKGFSLAQIRTDFAYEASLTPRFRFVIEAWKAVIDANNKRNQHNGDVNNSDGDAQLLKKGYEALEVLKKLLVCDCNESEPKQINKQTDALIREIKVYFGTNSLFHNITKEPFRVVARNYSQDLTWKQVEDDIRGSFPSQPMLNYPIVKIISAGIENHLNNYYKWEQVSQEVDRAIENRSSSEILILQEHSSLDWLWNLGALAPLLGLFGTVTGITSVFAKIAETKITDTGMLIQELSSGIFEALWTTIFGLFVGILLMIFYYSYKNRLEWIFNKWTALTVHVTEKL